MALALCLFLPLIASSLSLLPFSRRAAAPITLTTAATVLVCAIVASAETTRLGRLDALDGWLTCDALGALVLALVAFVAFTAALFSWGYMAHREEAGVAAGGLPRYYALFNLFVLSMLAVPILANVALMWIAVELTTLLSAFLVGFEDTAEALEAAWKYVMLTTLGAVLALLGFLILYWGSRVAGYEPFTWAGLSQAAPHMPPSLLWPAFLLILVGFGTKVGLVPMHTWLPDAHSQAPAPVCALLSGVETTTVLYVILRLFPVVGANAGLDPRPWFVGFGLTSVAIATLLLIYVRDFKRMFAFSTIEHMGIILVAAGLGGLDAHLGAAMQMTAHAATKSFCFFAAGATVMAVKTQEIESIRGLARSSPLVALAFVAGAFAIAGAPPFGVFISEFLILRAGFAAGQPLVGALLAFFVVVAFCAVVFHANRMAFGAVESRTTAGPTPASCKLALTLAFIPVVLFGVYVPAPLRDLLEAAAHAMGG
ncbi:proton-conducting transporter membrane subunit [Rhodoblastus sp.]|uniref:proton-conducting transporter transmembrane domain-containing protein n=1 Tax=Rhodoblastus sp. TaxID=1962975 RepID=UPI00263052A8|nr:proton-conducting transporter membrane subunit [Rhodoblastus sp.]